jgi:hypothetical protein
LTIIRKNPTVQRAAHSPNQSNVEESSGNTSRADAGTDTLRREQESNVGGRLAANIEVVNDSTWTSEPTTGPHILIQAVCPAAGRKWITVLSDDTPNNTRGPSRSIADLIKAYSSNKTKFSGEDPEQSLRLVRRSFFSACLLMHVNPSDALPATFLPLTASALEYYYEFIEVKAANVDEVFEMLRERFQTRTVQERALSKWQTLDFASQRSESDISDHDTLQNLFFKAKRIDRCLPPAFSDYLHLRDLLLRACASEPFCSRIPDEPAESSADAHAQLSAALSRYLLTKHASTRQGTPFLALQYREKIHKAPFALQTIKHHKPVAMMKRRPTT